MRRHGLRMLMRLLALSYYVQLGRLFLTFFR
jgi:hypothetical protein